MSLSTFSPFKNSKSSMVLIIKSTYSSYTKLINNDFNSGKVLKVITTVRNYK